MKINWIRIRDITVTLLSERSTWQGIGFFVGLFASKELANADWGAACAVGAAISAFIKIPPDSKK